MRGRIAIEKQGARRCREAGGRCRFAGLAALVALLVPMAAAYGNDAWMQVGGVDRSNLYLVALRGGRCEWGLIVKVDPGSIIIGPAPPTTGKPPVPPETKTLPRADVIRIAEGPYAHGMLYSGRRSWADVKQCVPGRREHLEVVLTSGRRMSVVPVAASDTELTLKSGARPVTLPKSDISRVAYVRFKPLPAGYQWVVQEAPFLALFSPKTWQYALKIDAMMTVPLYDSGVSEDNSNVGCDAQ